MDENFVKVTIKCDYLCMEQRLFFEAVVLPEIEEVLQKYSDIYHARKVEGN